MKLEFLAFANVVLLTRLVVLFRDDAVGIRAWTWKTAAELAMLFSLYRPSTALAAAAAVAAIANLAGGLWEVRARRRDVGRLLIGLGSLLALSVCFSPAAEIAFRPALGEWWTERRTWTALAPIAQALGSTSLHLGLLGLLLGANEANLLIRAAFDWLNLKPQTRGGIPGRMELDVGEYNRGRVIGLLERALIYCFVLHGQFGVIGFTLAAKAFTRFKELDDRRFAEYVLIGTLLSAGLAVAVALATKSLLGT